MNGSNSIDLDKVKKTVKNMKNTNLINKNIVLAVIILVMIEIKKLKAQILKLKVKLKNFKYKLKKDYKLSSSIKGNKKSSYKRLNCKPVNKKNLEYYKCSKKDYFKSECYSKLKDRIDYKNV